MPTRVRARVEEALGSPVVAAVDQTGGMSPGPAVRLRGADGSRLFVKACPASLNPVTPQLLRREAVVLDALGRHPRWAALEHWWDEALEPDAPADPWVVLLLEDVEGRHPDLDSPADVDAVVSAVDALPALLHHRLPSLDPLLDAGRRSGAPLGSTRDSFSVWAASLQRASEVLPTLGPPWLADLTPLAAVLHAVPAGDRLVHWDVRSDNLLLRPDGSVVVVDWGQALVGPSWVDAFLAREEHAHLPWFDAAALDHPDLAALGEETVTALLAAFATHLLLRAGTAQRDQGMPTLRAFRVEVAHHLLVGVARRLGLPAPTR
ncbi:phosphotransferase family protein [Nocardioides bruguierae]|uniref:Aminoglycoside phosphotransferase family protein n=1 Tax=Nocardioides bruguierae TaxID=2945102 RepID=A0A9X2DAL6_9ACTN|nr:aminoglycoside phosphotransferase family protein [Nocardioides bruguierae]MCM0621872.1 aminoglycoside phosphotransferase family protein [Nocardioides bruguierae]